jgi:hypothetical protein
MTTADGLARLNKPDRAVNARARSYSKLGGRLGGWWLPIGSFPRHDRPGRRRQRMHRAIPTRPSLTFALGSFVLLLAGCGPRASHDLQHAHSRFQTPHVIDNALVGESEDAIIAAHGRPKLDRPAYEVLGFTEPRPIPSGPIRTLVFRTDDGTLWVWLKEREDRWICFESCWFDDSVQF